MSYFAKVHLFEKEKLIAICDKELLGKKIPHNGVKLNINPRFYGELEYTEEEVLIEAQSSTQVNAMGQKICELLIENGLVHPDSVMWMEYEGQKVGHVILVG